MAVGADDVTLRDLVEDLLARSEQRRPRDVEAFFRWVSMIEVHGVRRKGTSAVCACNTAQISQPMESGLLPTPDSLDFLRAIPRVVGDVVWTLITVGDGLPV